MDVGGWARQQAAANPFTHQPPQLNTLGSGGGQCMPQQLRAAALRHAMSIHTRPEWHTAAWAMPAQHVCRCCNPTQPTFRPERSASKRAQQHCKPCDCMLQCRRCSPVVSSLLARVSRDTAPPCTFPKQSAERTSRTTHPTSSHGRTCCRTLAPAKQRQHVLAASSGSMQHVPIGTPTCGGGSAAGPSALDGPAAPAAAPPSRPARAPERPKYSMRGPRPRPSYTSRMRT